MTTAIRRDEIKAVFDRLVASGQIFSVECPRRTDLLLTYRPHRNLSKHGGHAHVGDHCELSTRRFVQGSNRRIILQPKGTLRTMRVRGKTDNEPTKHWRPTPGGTLPFNPIEKGLYLVYAMYPDQEQDLGAGKRYSRHDQHRSWCFVDMKTVERIRVQGRVFEVK